MGLKLELLIFSVHINIDGSTSYSSLSLQGRRLETHEQGGIFYS